jgi:DNA-binding transcriptional regulator YbjK
MSTRQRALDAAVDVIGTEGVRALTHARVDAAAGLPRGSTSNHFRTRAALVAGVITRIAEQERSDSGAPQIRTATELAAALTQMIELQSGAFAARTRARYALFLEADPDAAAPLHTHRAGFESWIGTILFALGGTAAEQRTRYLMATCDGLLLHRLTVDPTAPVASAVGLAVASAIDGVSGAPHDNQPAHGRKSP